jgi:hypothetical protein
MKAFFSRIHPPFPPRARAGSRRLACLLILGSAFAPGAASGVDDESVSAQTSSAQAWVESLPNSVVDEALESLWARFPDLRRKTPDAARRSALLGYLAGQMPGVRLLPTLPSGEEASPQEQTPFHAEILPDRSAYVRLGSWSPDLPARLDTALADWLRLGLLRVILDLRSKEQGGSLQMAAQLAGRFLPEGIPLFLVSSSGAQSKPAEMIHNQWASPWVKDAKPGSTRLLVVLVGGQTAGPTEALAAALRARARAILIGHSTPGCATDFGEISLGVHGRLRVPVAEPVWEKQVPSGDGFNSTTGTVLGRPLVPDIRVTDTESAVAAVLAEEMKQGKLGPFTLDPERPRMNEAALVAGRNPEWEESIRLARAPKTAGSSIPTRDSGLRAALDFFKGWEVFRPR